MFAGGVFFLSRPPQCALVTALRAGSVVCAAVIATALKRV
jgi:hypothetical protein